MFTYISNHSDYETVIDYVYIPDFDSKIIRFT